MSPPFYPINLFSSWGFIPSSSIHREDSLDLESGLVYPFLLYCVWQVETISFSLSIVQVSYLIITEGFLRHTLLADPQLVTSVRCQQNP